MGTLAVRHFDADYLERAVLHEGTEVLIRLVRPEDRELLREGFLRMSPESRYARFLGPKDSLTDDELRYLTEVDQERHLALGALVEAEGGLRGVGVARFIRLAEPPGTAEAAVAVVDEMRGRGLGKLLFLRLCAAALERGVGHFRCEVLGSNTGMRALIEDIAAELAVEVHAGVLTFDMAIPGVAPRDPMHGPGPEGAMYRLFRAAAENTVEWTGAVRRLWRRE